MMDIDCFIWSYRVQLVNTFTVIWTHFSPTPFGSRMYDPLIGVHEAECRRQVNISAEKKNLTEPLFEFRSNLR